MFLGKDKSVSDVRMQMTVAERSLSPCGGLDSQPIEVSPLVASEAADLLLALIKCQSVTEDILSEFGVNPRRYQALLVLRLEGEEDGLTVGEIGEHLSIARNTATELLKRMESDGLVMRLRDLIDQRIVKVTLSGKGSALLDRVSDANIERLGAAHTQLRALLVPESGV